jgi:Glycosyl transferases group 1
LSLSPTHTAAPAGRTAVHLIGRLSDAVYSFVGPVTAALSAQGSRQFVVMIDDPRLRHLQCRLSPAIELRLVPARGNLAAQWRRLLCEFDAVLTESQPCLVHLHGVLPVLGASRVLRRHAGPNMDVCFSPHGSRAIGPWRVIGASLLRGLHAVQARTIATLPSESDVLATLTEASIELVEGAVADAFFATPRHEAAEPLVLGSATFAPTGGAELFAQLAVLFDAHRPLHKFEWIGQVSAPTEARLQAARVGRPDEPDEPDDALRAERVAAAWVYIAPAPSRGFPLGLAEAMAAGLPCIALDTPQHRDLINHGQTGLLCRNLDEFMFRVELLLASRALRERLGQAARRMALRRFTHQRLRRRVLNAYGPRRSPIASAHLHPIENLL